jgi:S1-C subfamily serine protease
VRFKIIPVLCGAALLAGVGACQTTSGTGGGSGSVSSGTSSGGASSGGQSANRQTLDEPIFLASMTSTIPHGQSIDTPGGDGFVCAPPVVHLTWSVQPGANFNLAHQDSVASAFREQGLSLVKGSTSTFKSDDPASEVDLLLAGTVFEYKMRSCRWGWDETYSGDATVKIRWELYSQYLDEVLFDETFVTEFKERRYRLQITDILTKTFEKSAHELAGNPRFREAVASASQADGARQALVQKAAWEPLRLDGPALRRQAFTANPDPVLDATVVLRSSTGHGSGFVVSSDGYILTNAHVVGRSSEITVRFRDGREFNGRILRRDERRDVALVKIEARGLPTLPLRSAPVKVGEEVFSIGAPLYESLSATVSSGIVSALRPGARKGYDVIQSDAIIHGGNSGGPLVDRNGNVVAIAVSIITDSAEKFGSGISMFIPIRDGLEKLELDVN